MVLRLRMKTFVTLALVLLCANQVGRRTFLFISFMSLSSIMTLLNHQRIIISLKHLLDCFYQASSLPWRLLICLRKPPASILEMTSFCKLDKKPLVCQILRHLFWLKMPQNIGISCMFFSCCVGGRRRRSIPVLLWIVNLKAQMSKSCIVFVV